MNDYNPRYARQINLLGTDGQQRLQDAHIMVIGAGGLGSPLLYYLAAAGVGTITIVDGDKVSRSNLNRQILYTEINLGQKKAEVAKTRLLALNPDIKIVDFCYDFTEDIGRRLLEGVDLVVLAVDNRETRLLVNRLCCEAGIPLVDGGVEGFGGYVTAVIPGKTPCLACWFGDTVPEPRNCQTLGAAAGVIGSMEAQAAVQMLTGDSELPGRMLFFDGQDWTAETVPGQRDGGCPACGQL